MAWINFFSLLFLRRTICRVTIKLKAEFINYDVSSLSVDELFSLAECLLRRFACTSLPWVWMSCSRWQNVYWIDLPARLFSECGWGVLAERMFTEEICLHVSSLSVDELFSLKECLLRRFACTSLLWVWMRCSRWQNVYWIDLPARLFSECGWAVLAERMFTEEICLHVSSLSVDEVFSLAECLVRFALYVSWLTLWPVEHAVMLDWHGFVFSITV